MSEGLYQGVLMMIRWFLEQLVALINYFFA